MGYRNYSTAVAHIVDKNGHGDFTTIASAISAASSGDTVFIRPGTYTEDITLKAGVNLTSFDTFSTNNVIVVGNCTFSGVGSVGLAGLSLTSNGSNALTLSGSSASNLSLTDCSLLSANGTAISYTCSSGSSSIKLIDCNGDISDGVSAIYSMSGAGSIGFNFCSFSNSSSSTAANTNSAGTIGSAYSQFSNPVTSSGTGALECYYSGFNTLSTNQIAITQGGSGDGNIYWCNIISGTASGVSIGNTTGMGQCTVSSSNANAITGAGTLFAGIITFTGVSSTINTSTVNKFTTYGGTIV